METRYATCPEMIPSMTTAELRQRYLAEDLFAADEVRAVYSHQDRVVLLGAVPASGPLNLTGYPEIRSEYFCDHRELGVVNVGGDGQITADDQVYDMPHGACLYLGRGTKTITLASASAESPARFYGFSAPAHTSYPNVLTLPGEGFKRELGDPVTSNRRTLNQYIHPDRIQSCQIAMGVTTLHPGSMWNTMPAHTHDRRMEAYLYFDMPEDARVIHIMGTPDETRHLVVANEQATIAPSWSLHCGVGTASYSFIWAMAGENQEFDDMDGVPVAEMM